MTNAQLKQFKAIDNMAERARFLLDIGVTVTTDIVDLDFVFRATVGEVHLPITGRTEEETIRKGTEWLREKAGMEATDAG